jgi:hypothetical protein
VVDVETRRDGGTGVVLQRSPVALDLLRASMGANGSHLAFFAPIAQTAAHAHDRRMDWPVSCLGDGVPREMSRYTHTAFVGTTNRP